MTTKTLRWFEAPKGVPAAFHNPSPPGDNPMGGSVVVCLNYKDYDNRAAGVEPWFLTHEIAVVTLIHEWGTEVWWNALKKGAQEMVDYAASDEEHGFNDGDFYGIYWICRDETSFRPEVYVGLAYANTQAPLKPVRGVEELPDHDASENHTWVTPQFAIPLQVEVLLPGERPRPILAEHLVVGLLVDVLAVPAPSFEGASVAHPMVVGPRVVVRVG